jgi:hypothetical protein
MVIPRQQLNSVSTTIRHLQELMVKILADTNHPINGVDILFQSLNAILQRCPAIPQEHPKVATIVDQLRQTYNQIQSNPDQQNLERLFGLGKKLEREVSAIQPQPLPEAILDGLSVSLDEDVRRNLKRKEEIKPAKKTPNDARDKWIYDRCCEGLVYDEIAKELKRIAGKKNWYPIQDKRGILQAAQRFAKRKDLPPPPPRQGE